jgi:hypothetical protein
MVLDLPLNAKEMMRPPWDGPMKSVQIVGRRTVGVSKAEQG